MPEARVTRDTVIHGFGPDLEPVLEVEPGTVVTFETRDCFDGQIRTEEDLVTEIDMARINAATGPVAVRGAEPGDSLADAWLPHATAYSYDDVLREVAEEAARLLVDEWGFTLEDAFVFLSVACDVGITQGCRPAPGAGMIARFRIPKLPACPAPFAELRA